MKPTTQAERDAICADARESVPDVEGISLIVFIDAAEHGQWLRCAAMAVTKFAYVTSRPRTVWQDVDAALNCLDANFAPEDADFDDLCRDIQVAAVNGEWDHITAACIQLARLTNQL